jgi:hypothetical protein
MRLLVKVVLAPPGKPECRTGVESAIMGRHWKIHGDGTCKTQLIVVTVCPNIALSLLSWL